MGKAFIICVELILVMTKKKLRERETHVERNIQKCFVVNPAFPTALIKLLLYVMLEYLFTPMYGIQGDGVISRPTHLGSSKLNQ